MAHLSSRSRTACVDEGMAEGLARIIARRLELHPILASYNHYVAAYRTLALALDVPEEELLRRIWELAAGEVATGFITSIDDTIARYGRSPLTPFQRVRLFARARNVFGTTNSVQSPDEAALLHAWREVLR